MKAFAQMVVNKRQVKKYISGQFERIKIPGSISPSFLIISVYIVSSFYAALLLSQYLYSFASQASLYTTSKISRLGNENYVAEKLVEANQIDSLIAEAVQNPQAPIPQDEDTAEMRDTRAQEHSVSFWGYFGIPTSNQVITLFKQTSCNIRLDTFGCYLERYSFLIPIFFGVLSLSRFSLNLKRFKKLRWRIGAFLILFELHVVVLVLAFMAGFAYFVIKINLQAETEMAMLVSQLELNESSDSHRLTYGSEAISSRLLETDSDVPTIVLAQDNQEIFKEILSISDTQTFVQAFILPTKLKQVNSLDTRNISQVLLPTNRLLVHQFNQKDLKLLLPVLAEKIIQHEYLEYKPNLDQDGEFLVLGSQDYQFFKEIQREKRKEAIEELIQKIRSEISRLDSIAGEANQYVSDVILDLYELENQYKKYVTDLEEDYEKYCEQTSQQELAECKEYLEVIQDNKRLIEENKTMLEQAKQDAEQAQSLATQYKSQYQQELTEMREYLKLLEDSPVNTQTESGVFLSDDLKIILNYDDGAQNYDQLKPVYKTEEEKLTAQAIDSIFERFYQEKTFSEYLNTALHEHLHRVSFVGENQIWPTFMEEGMTELLAFQAISKYVESSQDLGLLAYSDQVEWLYHYQSINDSQELERLYFQDKSELKLKDYFEESLEGFDYDDFVRSGETLFYLGYAHTQERNQLKQDLQEMITNVE